MIIVLAVNFNRAATRAGLYIPMLNDRVIISWKIWPQDNYPHTKDPESIAHNKLGFYYKKVITPLTTIHVHWSDTWCDIITISQKILENPTNSIQTVTMQQKIYNLPTRFQVTLLKLTRISPKSIVGFSVVINTILYYIKKW